MMHLSKYSVVAMALMLLGAPQLKAQWGFDEPETFIYFDFRVDLGIMVVENHGTEGFVPARTTSYGFHLEAGHDFDRFSVYSGLGFNLFPFRQRQVQPIGGFIERERVSAQTRYFSLEVPVGLGFELTSSLSVHAALKMHFMRLRNTEHNFNSENFPTGVVLTIDERNEMDNWQLIPEVSFGFDYDIGSRLRIAFFGGFSLANLQGVSWDYTLLEIGDDPVQYQYDMSYSWFRYGAGLTYHIVR